MADKFSVTTPVDLIKTPVSGPKYSTSTGKFDGEPGYPGRTQGTGHAEKIYDGAVTKTPTDETRDDKA